MRINVDLHIMLNLTNFSQKSRMYSKINAGFMLYYIFLVVLKFELSMSQNKKLLGTIMYLKNKSYLFYKISLIKRSKSAI